jgi:hypothetical protein
VPFSRIDWTVIAGGFAAVATVLFVVRSQRLAPNRRKARLRGWKENP